MGWSIYLSCLTRLPQCRFVTSRHGPSTSQVFGRPQWMTPEGRSRQYVREICRRIGEDKIELGNACRRVASRDPKAAGRDEAGVEQEEQEEEEAPAEVLVEAVAGASEGSDESADGVKVKKEKEEEAGRWEVVDAKGETRFFDEVRGQYTR